MNASTRWALLPVACLVGYIAACIVGDVALGVAELFCPADQMVSGSCIAPWFERLEDCVSYFCAGLAAAFVVIAAFAMAPVKRAWVAWCAFGFGAVVALYLAVLNSAWPEFVSALVVDIIVVLLISRSIAGNVAQPNAGANGRGGHRSA